MLGTATAKPAKGDWRLRKARLSRRHREQRDACRARVYARDRGCCVRCGRPVKLHYRDGAEWWDIANIHEIVPRSLGGSPYDDDNCETLCSECHTGKGYHAK